MSAEPTPILALPGPQYWYDFAGGEFEVCDKPIIATQEGGQGRGTGWSVWDGAVAAAKHLEALQVTSRLPAVDPHTAIELGSGTGLSGLAAAVITGLPTTLTDLPEVLPALRRNVDLNRQVAPKVSVQALDWRDPATFQQLSPPYGLVVAADCVWLEELVEPFVRALEQVAGPTSQVLLAYQSRSSRVDSLLFSQLERQFDAGMAEQLPEEGDRGKIDIYWLRKRQRQEGKEGQQIGGEG